LACMAIICIAMTGCASIWGKEVKASFCKDHPEDGDCPHTGPDGGDGHCASNATCKSPTSVCDIAGSMTCVQCIAPDEASACVGTTPVCEADHACHACGQHTDCPLSSACLPDGSCASTTDVAYVDPLQGVGSACTLAAPCKRVSDALATARPYVKLKGTIDEAVTINGGRVVAILADPGTTLTRTNGNGAVLTAQDDGTSVSIYDLLVHNGLNSPSSIGYLVPAGNGAPTLSLVRARVTNNAGGGISFADGHSEIKRWKEPNLLITQTAAKLANTPFLEDLSWLQERSTSKE